MVWVVPWAKVIAIESGKEQKVKSSEKTLFLGFFIAENKKYVSIASTARKNKYYVKLVNRIFAGAK